MVKSLVNEFLKQNRVINDVESFFFCLNQGINSLQNHHYICTAAYGFASF